MTYAPILLVRRCTYITVVITLPFHYTTGGHMSNMHYILIT